MVTQWGFNIMLHVYCLFCLQLLTPYSNTQENHCISKQIYTLSSRKCAVGRIRLRFRHSCWYIYVLSALTLKFAAFCTHSVFVCFCDSKINRIKWLLFVIAKQFIYCSVRTGFWIAIQTGSKLQTCNQLWTAPGTSTNNRIFWFHSADYCNWLGIQHKHLHTCLRTEHFGLVAAFLTCIQNVCVSEPVRNSNYPVILGV